MVAVLLLFLLPVGGGIPAGVLMARDRGVAWPVMMGLYLVSDVILALAFEPLLRLLVLLGRRVAFLARLGAAMKEAMARSVAMWGGAGAGPFALVLIAFGVDPMTGRASALAAGHGPISGWALAITGDMLYFAVLALATLRLNAWIKNPETTVMIVLGLMIAVPMVVHRLRARKVVLEGNRIT